MIFCPPWQRRSGGSPPPKALPIVQRSGVTPRYACIQPGPVRKPEKVLIEDEHDVMVGGQGPQRLEEAWPGPNAAGVQN